MNIDTNQNVVYTFSIVVPVYNVENYIRQCVESILNQTFQDFELILIDDGSTDSSGKLCQSWVASDHRVKYYHHNNGGPNKARNLALDVLLGKFVIFVDADDWIEPSSLSVLEKHLRDEDYDVINYGYDFFEDGSTKIVESRSNKLKKLLGKEVIIEALFGARIAGVCWNKCFKNSMIAESNLRFLPDKLHARDVLFTREAAMYSKKALIIPNILYHSRCRPGSFSRSFGNGNVYSAIDLADKHLEIFGNAYNCDLRNLTEYSIGKSLRYILVLSAFRSISYLENINNFNIVRSSRFWYCTRPNKVFFKFYTLRDFLLSIFILNATIARLVASISKKIGFRPY